MPDKSRSASAGKPGTWEKVAAYAEWALKTPDARWEKRRHSSPEELRSFYDAIMPHLEEMLAECDKFPLGGLPESHHDLLNLALAAAEVAPHVELYDCSPRVPNSFDETQFIGSRGKSEIWRGD